MADETETTIEDEAPADEFAGYTEEDFRREVYVAREGVRRLQAGIESMEENRDHWQARAERAESALVSFGMDVQARIEEIRTPNA